MAKNASYAITVLKRLCIVLFAYWICRLLFFAFNRSSFSDVSWIKLIPYFIYGFRFDVSAILITNVLFILLSLLPIVERDRKGYQLSLKIIFIISNGIALLANCADFIYFEFTFKRCTADVFSLLALGDDTSHLLPLFIKDYWYIWLMWVGLILLILFLYNQTENKRTISKKLFSFHYFYTHSLILFFFAFIVVIGFRGGFQLKPISIINASEYTSPQDIPLVINTPFSIIKTLGQEKLVPENYFSEQDLAKNYSAFHPTSQKKFKKLNVVILILESFSKEYIGSMNAKLGKSNTPFLDSLFSQSLVFENAFSDGKKSIEGIPAITAGIPTWMNNPYITSAYGSNKINSLASLLKQEDYTTAFYHGGTNGTMGFDNFANFAGFDHYYGRTEYHNDADYDGHWGIWDEQFFQFFAQHLNKTKQPFFATIFSISSHHPYSIPDKYKNKFKQQGDEYPILKTVRYTDFSLREFFKTISKMPFFDSTLFVITPDHASISSDPFFMNRVGAYEIPIVFYMPNSNLKGKDYSTVQQIDIMPTVLDYLNYDKSYFAFGKSGLDTTSQHYAVNYLDNAYEIIKQNYALFFDGKKTLGLYHFSNDSLLKNNLQSQYPHLKDSMETAVKSVIQSYNQSLISNQMTTH
ncbi:MAG: sulfatase-like hydrolase/transferase [Bacteroidia bacterium]